MERRASVDSVVGGEHVPKRYGVPSVRDHVGASEDGVHDLGRTLELEPL